MTILKLYEFATGSTKDCQVENVNEPLVRVQRTRMFHVETDSEETTDVEIENATLGGVSIPRPFQLHPNDPYVFVRGVVPRQMGASRRFWEVEVRYGGVQSYSGETPETEKPLARWESVSYEVPVNREYTSDPSKPAPLLLNAADQPYDPPLRGNKSNWLFRFECNVLTENTAFWTPFLDAINTDTFLGFLPLTGRVAKIGLEPRFRGPFSYWRGVLEIEFTSNRIPVAAVPYQGGFTLPPENIITYAPPGGLPVSLGEFGWVHTPPNMGYRYKATVEGDAVYPPFKDPDPDNPEKKHLRELPTLLNASGTGEVANKATGANYRAHNTFKLARFADMAAGFAGL